MRLFQYKWKQIYVNQTNLEQNTNLAACALELSKACESEVLVQLMAFGVKWLPQRHSLNNSGPSPPGPKNLKQTKKKKKIYKHSPALQ